MLKIAGLLLKNIPRFAGYFFFRLTASLLFIFPSKRKNTVISNLRTITGQINVSGTAHQVYQNYAVYYFELFRSQKELLARADFESFSAMRSKIDEALAKYNGLVLVSLHYNNWDLAGAYLSSLYPGRVTVVVEQLSDKAYKWFTETRSSWGMNVLTASDLKGMLRALKNGHILVLLGDRDLERNGYKMDFFGKKAYIPSGPAKLAQMAKVPLAFSVFKRLKGQKYEFVPSIDRQFLNDPPLERSEENSENIAKQLVLKFEQELIKDPSQWCMLQQVWID